MKYFSDKEFQDLRSKLNCDESDLKKSILKCKSDVECITSFIHDVKRKKMIDKDMKEKEIEKKKIDIEFYENLREKIKNTGEKNSDNFINVDEINIKKLYEKAFIPAEQNNNKNGKKSDEIVEYEKEDNQKPDRDDDGITY